MVEHSNLTKKKDMSNLDPETPDTISVPESLTTVISCLSRQLNPDRIGTGPLAELRRMDIAEFPPAFWKIYLKDIPAEWREPQGNVNPNVDRAWVALIRAMAEVAPNSNVPDATFGGSLAIINYSEMRFIRMLRASSDQLAREIRVACATMHRKGQKTNFYEVAQLLLGDVAVFRKPAFRKQIHAERCRHKIARDYFHAIHQQSTSSEETT